MFILDDILLAPVKGVVWVANKVKEQAEERLYNVTALKEALQELQRRYEEGTISKQEYEGLEVKFLNAIEEATRYHRARREAGLEE